MEEQIVKHEGAAAAQPKKAFGSITNDRYLMLAVALVLISIVYWSVFSANALNTYHEYDDLGRANYDMFYHTVFPSAVHGLQYLVFENHFMPDQLLIIPFYALAPSPLTLLVIQDIVLCATGLVAFFIAKDLLKSPKIGLILCIAFLLNPGMHGILSFDYHAEAAIPLFVLLVFYFMVKRRPVLFGVSLFLLFGLIDVSQFVGLGLGLAMMAYAFLREKDQAARRSLMRYSAVVIGASVLALFVYSVMVTSLSSAYVAGQYSALPQFLKLNGIVGEEVAGIATNFTSSGAVAVDITYFFPYLLYAVALAFLGFGIAGLLDPVLMVLFISPWLAAAFILNFSNTIFIWNQYFSYALGGGIIATILAIRHVNDHHEAGRNSVSLFKYGKGIAKYLPASILACALILFILSPHFVYSKNINNLQQDYLFQITPAEKAQVEQLTSMIALIPKNASVMGPFFAMSQLSNRQYFEEIPATFNSTTIQPSNTPQEQNGMWFQPEYIVADFNPYISLNAGSGYQIQDFVNITGATIVNGSATFNGPYEIYAYNGTALLLKRR
jgi:uncharacterized membrane protein